jgi:HAMP domain-containing protein
MSMQKNSQTTKTDMAAKIDISIRWKVIIGFGVLFVVVYLIALRAFIDIATAAADTQIQEDLTQVLQGAADGVDVDKLIALSQTGEPNEAGFTDDPRFDELLDWLDTMHQAEPDAWPYLYIPAPEEDPNGLYGVVDLWARYDPDSAYGFMEFDISRSGALIRGFSVLAYRPVDHPLINDIRNFGAQYEETTPAVFNAVNGFADFLENLGFEDQEFGTYGDQFGRWASGYMPLEDSSGNVVAAIGVDFQADTVNEVRSEMQSQVQRAFLIAGPVMLVLVFVVSNWFTRPLIALSGAAERVGEGDYAVEFTELISERNRDEIDQLASVFSIMVDKVRVREQTLMKQVAELKIEIDEAKQQSQVSEIVETDFFRDLQSRANRMKKGRKDSDDS